MIDEENTVIESDSQRSPQVEVRIPDTANRVPLDALFRAPRERCAVPWLPHQLRRWAGARSAASRASRVDRPVTSDAATAPTQLEWGAHRQRAVEALRGAGKSRRGLSDTFFREIASEYLQLIEGGDPHPIKTIADKRPVHKSRASRWVREARDRGYIPNTEGRDA